MTGSELINSIDFDEMLCKLSKDETLADFEVRSLEDFISTQIKLTSNKRSLEDLFAALTVISKSGLRSLAYLAEQCLEIPDPLLASLAIETLVFKWGMGDRYEERLIQFLLGVPHDHDGDLKETSIRCVGELIKERSINNLNSDLFPHSISSHDVKLFHLIIQIVEDAMEDDYIRNAAYETILSVTSNISEVKENIDNKKYILEYLKSQFSESSSKGFDDDRDMSETGMR
jgi:hypothetical protein